MADELSAVDRRLLADAVELSGTSLSGAGLTPFGAVLAVAGEVVATGVSSVVARRDPTAHAEVLALRAAGESLGTHLFPDAVLYSSSQPCPMCLCACYWAQLPRVVYAATSADVDRNGFADLRFRRQLGTPGQPGPTVEVGAGGPARAAATAILADWARRANG